MNTTHRANVKYTLTDGNAFAVLADFRRAARHADWSAEQLKDATNECLAGDNTHLMCTIASYCAAR